MRFYTLPRVPLIYTHARAEGGGEGKEKNGLAHETRVPYTTVDFVFRKLIICSLGVICKQVSFRWPNILADAESA